MTIFEAEQVIGVPASSCSNPWSEEGRCTYRCDDTIDFLHIKDLAEKTVICLVDGLASVLMDKASSGGAYCYLPVGMINDVGQHDEAYCLVDRWKLHDGHVSSLATKDFRCKQVCLA